MMQSGFQFIYLLLLKISGSSLKFQQILDNAMNLDKKFPLDSTYS